MGVMSTAGGEAAIGRKGMLAVKMGQALCFGQGGFFAAGPIKTQQTLDGTAVGVDRVGTAPVGY